MSVREFIAAIPKVELNLQLTGAFSKESLLMIAHQNGIPAELEDFDVWVNLLDDPDYDRLDEIARVAGKWVRYPEDIARVVYDIGVVLSKQNVRYAEVVVSPSDFLAHGMSIEVFIDALNDGRDRALRGWNVDMSWIFSIPRDNPRAADDAARWATGAAARRGNVVALALLGPEDAQPVGQFRRAFATARKKDVFTVAHAGGALGMEGIADTLDELNPHRLTDCWGIHADNATLGSLAEAELPLVTSISRALRLGLIKRAADYPLQQLVDSGLPVVLSSGMPSLYQTSLIDEYMLAHEACELGVDETIELVRRSISLSYMDGDAKKEMLANFERQVRTAKAALLNPG